MGNPTKWKDEMETNYTTPRLTKQRRTNENKNANNHVLLN